MDNKIIYKYKDLVELHDELDNAIDALQNARYAILNIQETPHVDEL